ncbi:SIR2 family NAD-dependent protein deacylase [Geopsychrobacter electrodiphilus]|uniref:SIR2 family NAD-dependent protein deacylase n=1 Tax=Geopsychrobacter electrodiphilus TaxID=225196 RepID=UPI00037ABB12|nr:Sir2 family NAD-dependent protein deacetylase [Geopsychrobacter electrodiphilus]
MRCDYAAAARLIAQADALIITAGAGMGVDSGLPDFRGDQGFWQAYPMYASLGLSFIDAANPRHFEQDPLFGWGFYGHRTNLYRQTEPHAGFQLLLDWIERFNLDSFVVTSNVDGQFQKAGFDERTVLEVHGSIHYLQCIEPCCHDVWPNELDFVIDISTMRAHRSAACPNCGGVARPNILMFGDYSWLSDRTSAQEDRFSRFLSKLSGKKLAVIEMGAGSAIPTIRRMSEDLGRQPGVSVIRINPREPQISGGHCSINLGALEGLKLLERYL